LHAVMTSSMATQKRPRAIMVTVIQKALLYYSL